MVFLGGPLVWTILYVARHKYYCTLLLSCSSRPKMDELGNVVLLDSTELSLSACNLLIETLIQPSCVRHQISKTMFLSSQWPSWSYDFDAHFDLRLARFDSFWLLSQSMMVFVCIFDIYEKDVEDLRGDWMLFIHEICLYLCL